MTWDKQPTHCPACTAAIVPDSAECAACGCVFAKWHAKAAREDLGARREKEVLAERRFQPAYDAPPPPKEESTPWLKRLAGVLCVAGAVSGTSWMLAPGGSGPAPEKLEAAGAVSFSFVPPTGWAVESRDPGCKDAGCVIAAYRLQGPRDRMNPGLQVRVLDEPPGRSRAELVELVKASLSSGYDRAGAPAVVEDLVVDGLPALRVETTGSKRMRVKTQDEVAMSAQAYLEQTGKHMVMARFDPTGRNPTAYVVTQEAQFSEFDVNKVDGVVLVPMRRKLVRLSYEYDRADAAVGEAAVKELLGGLRVPKDSRARPYDRLGDRNGLAMAAVSALGLFGVALLLI